MCGIEKNLAYNSFITNVFLTCVFNGKNLLYQIEIYISIFRTRYFFSFFFLKNNDYKDLAYWDWQFADLPLESVHVCNDICLYQV